MPIASSILVIDDEPQIRRVVRNALDGVAGRVVEAATGREGIDLAAADRPNLIILDLGLPDISGAAVCREIRAWCSAPIIVLSARHSDTEKVAMLDAGADDYVTKPFSTPELQARVRAQIRRAAMNESGDETGAWREGWAFPSSRRKDEGGTFSTFSLRSSGRGHQFRYYLSSPDVGASVGKGSHTSATHMWA